MPALLLLLCAQALAASRLIIEAPGTLTIILDNQAVSTGAGLGRYTLGAVSPGRHTLQIRDNTGRVLGQSVFELADNTSATATWDGASIRLVGATVVSDLAATPDAPFKAEGDTPEAQDLAALQAANDQDASNQKASAHGQGASSRSEPAGGRIPPELQRYAGQAASAAIGVPSIVSDPLATTVGSSFAHMVRNAEAGGMRRTYNPAARQGNPNVPPPVLEQVKLINQGGRPMIVYCEGMFLHEFAAGQTEKLVKLEVGRRELQFVDPARKEIVWQGALRVKEKYVVELAFSPSEAPRALNANWAWANL